jgi:predicted RNA binding protein YcfA (HicA-like mRNA interferase family)
MAVDLLPNAMDWGISLSRVSVKNRLCERAIGTPVAKIEAAKTLMGSNLYPEIARLLVEAGCRLVRQGKGSHEIWESPITGRRFTVPRKTVIVYTANGILKDAGLPKAF